MANVDEGEGKDFSLAPYEPGTWHELIGPDIELKILDPGEGPIAEAGQLIRCQYVGRLRDTGEVFETADDTGFRIGDNDTTPALELGLRHMRKGERALIRCTSKYAFGPFGRKVVGWGGQVEIPPDAGLEYEAYVKELYPIFSVKDAPPAARVFEANLKKQHGNRFFHHQDWSRAVRCYQSALKVLDPGEADADEDGYKEVIKMYCDISNNLAATLLKMKMPKEAQEACIKVIELDSNNVKALYRGGMAALEQLNFEEAELALKEACKLAPDDGAIKNGLRLLAQRRATYKKKEAEMYKQMSGFLLKKKDQNTEGESTTEESKARIQEEQEVTQDESESVGEKALEADVEPLDEEEKTPTAWENAGETINPATGPPRTATTTTVSTKAFYSQWVTIILMLILPVFMFWDQIGAKISQFLQKAAEATPNSKEL